MVYKEVVQVLGDTDRDITSVDISKMYLLEQCIYETMRLYPVVPALPRTATADVALGQYFSCYASCLSNSVFSLVIRTQFNSG